MQIGRLYNVVGLHRFKEVVEYCSYGIICAFPVYFETHLTSILTSTSLLTCQRSCSGHCDGTQAS